MRGILGKKLGMTRIFNEEGHSIPVTVIKAGPCVITALRTREKNGYEAIQIGFEEIEKGKRISKPVKGQFDKKNLTPCRVIREIRGASPGEYQLGQKIAADIFKKGEKVDVTGTSIGKGFAGAMKRHHFSGGPSSHGSTTHRKPCSAGATASARTFLGKRGPGHMGAARRTVQSLEIVRVDADKNLLMVRGAVPGSRNSVLMIRNTIKIKHKKKPRIPGTQNK